ncbi:hypothetical protein [Serratia sp. DD3]|uniref:hypothetical protein n=1 Tax=Serratia sp. DD3 TaxID=1410619 RepID=UPI0003F57A5E|nr:hypothetical protein [Serratia sp. DD3]
MHAVIFTLLLFFITSPLLASEMRYPPGEEPLNLPANSSLMMPLPRSVHSLEDKKAETMPLYLSLIHEDKRNVWVPFQLAATSAQKGQTELAEHYLQLSAKRGLWYYYNLLENNAFNSLQQSETYRSILAEAKTRYQLYASPFEGKAQYSVPNGSPPATGWPTVIYLHPYGRAANITPKDRLLFAEAGVAYIELNGTQMLAENSFRWSIDSEESTHSAIQRTLQELTPKLKLNPHQVYLTARGQGALHAGNLMAKYPQFYAGALLITPQGKIPPASYSLAENKRIMIAYYGHQNFNGKALALHFTNLFSNQNLTKTASFNLREDTQGNWPLHFQQPLRWVMGKSADASPGA